MGYKSLLADLADNDTEELALFRTYMEEEGDECDFSDWLRRKIACRDQTCEGHCECRTCDCCVCDQGRCGCEICDECKEHDSCSCPDGEEDDSSPEEASPSAEESPTEEKKRPAIVVPARVYVWNETTGTEVVTYDTTGHTAAQVENLVAICSSTWPKYKVIKENC